LVQAGTGWPDGEAGTKREAVTQFRCQNDERIGSDCGGER